MIKSEDVPKLLDLGKRSIYVYENDGTMLHEDDAARILEKVTKGRNLDSNDPKEGKIELTAAIDGLFWSDTDALKKLNSNVEISIASRLSGFPVHKGDKCAGMRVIPLMIKKETMESIEQSFVSPIFSVLPLHHFRCGVVKYIRAIKDMDILEDNAPRLPKRDNSRIGSCLCTRTWRIWRDKHAHRIHPEAYSYDIHNGISAMAYR